MPEETGDGDLTFESDRCSGGSNGTMSSEPSC